MLLKSIRNERGPSPSEFPPGPAPPSPLLQYGKGSVNYSKADPFSCPAPGRSAAPEDEFSRQDRELETILLKPRGAIPVPGAPRRAPRQDSVDRAAP